jgi:hypothetical protein
MKMLYDEDHPSRDRKQLSHLKMADVYGWLIDQIIDHILKDLT